MNACFYSAYDRLKFYYYYVILYQDTKHLSIVNVAKSLKSIFENNDGNLFQERCFFE